MIGVMLFARRISNLAKPLHITTGTPIENDVVDKAGVPRIAFRLDAFIRKTQISIRWLAIVNLGPDGIPR